MKVIQVIPMLKLAGAERMCETLTLELKKRGVDVQVISLFSCDTSISQRLIQAGVKVFFLNKRPGLDISMIGKLKKIFIQEKPDVVHSHLDALKYVMLVANYTSVPLCIHTVHNLAQKELNKNERLLVKWFYKKRRVIPVALSDIIRESIMEVYGVPSDLIPVVFNGIDLSKCIPKTNYTLGETIRVLHIGRFSNQKNHKGLIDAFKLFNSMKPNAVLELIGEGENFNEIKNYVEENSLIDDVIFLGKKNNVYPYINGADIFILPSLYEGIPMTLIEAMGTGIPIIATKVGGIPNMLSNNENAILTSINSEEIAECLIMLSNNLEYRQEIGKNALVRSKDFSSEEMAHKYLEIYRGGMNDRFTKSRI